MSGLFPDGPAEPQLAPTVRRGMGRMLAGGPAAQRPRQGNDYYPTPAAVTHAFLAVEGQSLEWATIDDGAVWEPCGRGGAIKLVLEDYGLPCIATDIVADPAHAVTQGDLLAYRAPLSRVVVTNPPFALAEAMIRHLWHDLQIDYCALLLKSTFWHAAGRTGLFRRGRPARIWALNWRPDFLGGGAPTMEVSWFVWDRRAPEGRCDFNILGPAPEAGLFSRPARTDEGECA